MVVAILLFVNMARFERRITTLPDAPIELSSKKRETLRYIAFGVRRANTSRPYFYCTDEPMKHVDSRSIDALVNRGLAGWFGAGGSTHQYHVELTPEGWKLFYEINAR